MAFLFTLLTQFLFFFLGKNGKETAKGFFYCRSVFPFAIFIILSNFQPCVSVKSFRQHVMVLGKFSFVWGQVKLDKLLL